jgi:hypothetical protein|tara:strand:+ start:344 stop:667 length:324 start_codon:yes stop_codon:yes gene_type:complete
MTHYYTPEQETQVTAFVDQFITDISWMKQPDGIDSLSDKATMDDGSIDIEAMIRWFIQFAMDSARDADIHGEELYDLIASAVLGWAKQSIRQEDRAALETIYERYIT